MYAFGAIQRREKKAFRISSLVVEIEWSYLTIIFVLVLFVCNKSFDCLSITSLIRP